MEYDVCFVIQIPSVFLNLDSHTSNTQEFAEVFSNQTRCSVNGSNNLNRTSFGSEASNRQTYWTKAKANYAPFQNRSNSTAVDGEIKDSLILK